MSINVKLDAAEKMDRMYRYQRHFYDATRKYYLLGRDRALDKLDPPKGGSILEIGCGTGRNLSTMAALYPEVRIYGLDISQEMLKSAAGRVSRKGMSRQIKLALGDATDFDAIDLFGTAGFDRILFSFSLSMIPAWRLALDQATRYLNEDGELHVVDFGAQSGLPDWFRSTLFAWLSKFGVHHRAGLIEALEHRSEALKADMEFQSLYRGYAELGMLRLRDATTI